MVWPLVCLSGADVSALQYSATMYAGVTSVYTTITLAGILTQIYWRTYHPRSFKKYNYILGGALDGGAQGELERSVLSHQLLGATQQASGSSYY